MNIPLQAPRPLPLSELGALRELARLSRHWWRLKRGRRGTAKVVVVPGYLTSDAATWALRKTLQRRGHRVHGWGLGRNHGNVPPLLDAFTQRVFELSKDEPVHLVGWSLGGYIAREVARDLPDRVTQVITLATPVVGGPKYTIAASLYRGRGFDLDEVEQFMIEREQVPLTVPITALYSPIDGIVSPAACIDHKNPNVSHIEIHCPHAGFVIAPRVLSIVADRLADPPTIERAS